MCVGENKILYGLKKHYIVRLRRSVAVVQLFGYKRNNKEK